MNKFCNKCGAAIAPDEKFCHKCGNALASVDSAAAVQPEVSKATFNTAGAKNNHAISSPRLKISKKKSLLAALGIGALLVVLFVVVGVGVKLGKKYYFNTDSTNGDSGEVISSGGGSKKSGGKYKTVIIHDNVYEGVSIDNSSDAYELIEKDSVSQKDQCSAEIKRVEDDIIKKYGITAVNLCEMNVDFAREVGKVFQKIYDEYPGARGYITNLTLVNAPMSEGYIAAFMPAFSFASSDSTSTYPWVIKTQVLLNSTYFLNPERLDSSVKSGSASGHFPKNATIYSPVAHELGHYLSFLAMMKNYDVDSILLLDNKNISDFYDVYEDFGSGRFSLSMIKEAFNNYKRDTNDNSMTLDQWRGTISEYALAKDNKGDYIYDETIAESFHDVYLNGDNAAAASKYVVQVLKERLGK